MHEYEHSVCDLQLEFCELSELCEWLLSVLSDSLLFLPLIDFQLHNVQSRWHDVLELCSRLVSHCQLLSGLCAVDSLL